MGMTGQLYVCSYRPPSLKQEFCVAITKHDDGFMHAKENWLVKDKQIRRKYMQSQSRRRRKGVSSSKESSWSRYFTYVLNISFSFQSSEQFLCLIVGYTVPRGNICSDFMFFVGDQNL